MKSLFAALVLTALPIASQADPLDIKTGDWELRQTTAITGIPVAKDVLDKMSASDRDQLEVKIRARADEGEQITSHSCVTQQTLDDNDLVPSKSLVPGPQGSCERKVIAQTGRYMELEESCAAPATSQTRIRAEANSVESYTASTNRTEGNGTVYVQIRGRWIGPTCAKGVDN